MILKGWHRSCPAPCANCPFRKQGGIRLTKDRYLDILASDAAFICHKTAVYGDDSNGADEKSVVCAGWLSFREQAGIPNLVMVLGQHLGEYDPEAVRRSPYRSEIVSTVKELLSKRWE